MVLPLLSDINYEYYRLAQTFNIFLCEFSKEKCSKQQHYVILRLHGKSNSAIISEEMLLEDMF